MRKLDGDMVIEFLKKRTQGIVLEENASCVRKLHKIISDLHKGIHKGFFKPTVEEFEIAIKEASNVKQG